MRGIYLGLLLLSTTGLVQEEIGPVGLVQMHRAVDGDTLDATLILPFGLEYRPPKGWRAADYDAVELSEPNGAAARELATEAIKNGCVFRLTRPRGELDKYGRPLAVFLVKRRATDAEYVPLKTLMQERGYLKGMPAP